ncbi:hypothetical protein [Jiangella muralis]|uniref:hypothetical protein n=1 Tax=Jiangella muralis TaxID=702383 RepID=UPI00069E4BFA|nr:hypothetical protein [Jiangella muralis]
MPSDPSADIAADAGDEPGAVELVETSDEIVAHGPDAPADVAAAVNAALESLGEAAANRERLRSELQACVFLALGVAWLGIGLAREWPEPRSWGWLWDVVAPLLATAWVVVAVATGVLSCCSWCGCSGAAPGSPPAPPSPSCGSRSGSGRMTARNSA